MPKKRIGDLLIERGLINENELQYALEMQKQTHEKLGEVLINNKIVIAEYTRPGDEHKNRFR